MIWDLSNFPLTSRANFTASLSQLCFIYPVSMALSEISAIPSIFTLHYFDNRVRTGRESNPILDTMYTNFMVLLENGYKSLRMLRLISQTLASSENCQKMSFACQKNSYLKEVYLALQGDCLCNVFSCCFVIYFSYCMMYIKLVFILIYSGEPILRAIMQELKE